MTYHRLRRDVIRLHYVILTAMVAHAFFFFFFFFLLHCLEQTRLRTNFMTLLYVAKGLKLPDFILLLLLKTNIGYKTFSFIMWRNFATFKFWATLELFRHHDNHKPNPFDFGIEYKSIDRTLQFHYRWLETFGLLEETDIESSVAFLMHWVYLWRRENHFFAMTFYACNWVAGWVGQFF